MKWFRLLSALQEQQEGEEEDPSAVQPMQNFSTGDVPNSPGLRRRRSRVPSEEDDKLINFLVAGGHDGSRERNTSLGNIGKVLKSLYLPNVYSLL